MSRKRGAMLVFAVLMCAAVACSVQALRVKGLIEASLWLAGASALVATLLYLLGAHQTAVIELSVGAGLVTVLLVFAISIAGDHGPQVRSLVPAWLVVGLVIGTLLLLGWLALPLPGAPLPGQETAFGQVFWQARSLDILVQIVLIYSSVLGVLGLLTPRRLPEEASRSERAEAESPGVEHVHNDAAAPPAVAEEVVR